MSNLNETPVWEEGIYQLTAETPVLGKQMNVSGDGPSNLQAQQLANRTQWLKLLVESASDYREFTFYTTESDPDGTIAGLANTPSGKFFRVAQGISGEYSFIYYLNNSGIAQKVAILPGQRNIELISETVQRLMTALHIVAESGAGSGTDPDTSEAVQNLMTGFNVLAESVNNLTVKTQQNASGLSRLVSSVQICTEMLNTLAA
ncbi:TPA: hypothetical protein RRZ88_004542, partial [Klebsiella pneumoniae]|nr:hypothetical protein [Klebsiella pneumoniae]